jgi:hypothetical protein
MLLLPVLSIAFAPEARGAGVSPSSGASPTIEAVFSEICRVRVRHPNIVIRQVILETGSLRNAALMAKNNLFAFKKSHYLHFANWKDSIAYYKSWQDKSYTSTSEDYYHFLVRVRYASPEYPNYLNGIDWDRNCNDFFE